MLWACLHFPDLAFAAAFDGLVHERPRALIDGPPQRRCIVRADAAARQLGVTAGQKLAAAQVLSPTLQALPRNAAREQALLQETAAFGYRFSAQVSLAPPQSVLLEIGASLALFGGWPALQRRLQGELSDMDLCFRLSAAPTAGAAWLLARHQHEVCITQDVPLQRMLAQLPLAHGGLSGTCVAMLHDMGFRHLRDIFHLPRPELERRIGREAMHWLDRLRGLAPDALETWRPPDRFSQRLEFDFEVRGGAPLLFSLQRLTRALAHMLTARDGGVQHMTLVLEHEGNACTHVSLELATPQRDAAMLFDLARTRLERVTLTAAVRALRLEARHLPTFHPERRDLFDPVCGEGLDWPTLCQRLTTRLGPTALRQLEPVSEHRPERAWRHGTPGSPAAREDRPRPLWLLPRPRVLRGSLHILKGPERLESGWWDGDDMRRDYYVVQTAHGQLAWACRVAGQADGWMLHGWFA